MILYVLEFYNGLEYEDACNVPLGYYSSKFSRERAKKRYTKYENEWPFRIDEREAKFVEWELKVNADLVPPPEVSDEKQAED